MIVVVAFLSSETRSAASSASEDHAAQHQVQVKIMQRSIKCK